MVQVALETVTARPIAAVRTRTPISEIPQAWKPALDKVWDFLRKRPELRHGSNLFLYHHPTQRDQPMDVDFGVTVTRAFEDAEGVACIETPAGHVAWALHRGPYETLPQTHMAIHAWCAANGWAIGAMSWEEYGDWEDDTAKLETTVRYLLRD